MVTAVEESVAPSSRRRNSKSLAKDRNRVVVLCLVVIDNAETLHAVGDLALVWCEVLTAQVERLLNQLRRPLTRLA